MRQSYLHRSYSMIICLLTAIGSYAQIVNDGAVITIEVGALLYTEVDVQNINSGTIANNGTIEMQADLLNNATLTSSISSKLVFSGDRNAKVTSGGATLADIEIDKITADVSLSDAMAIDGQLDFLHNDNHIHLGAYNLVLGMSSSITGYDNTRYIVTGSTGQVIRSALGALYLVPIGYDEATYNPISIRQDGIVDDIGVRLMEHVYEEGLTPTTAITADAVDATWVITEAVAGGCDLYIEPQWSSGDEPAGFDRTMVAVSRHDGATWTVTEADLGAATGTDPYTQSKAGFNEIGAFSVGAGVLVSLPIELLSFAAQKGIDEVELTWHTRSEINSSHFDIERSSDVQVWQYLASVDAKRLSIQTTSYDYYDRDITHLITTHEPIYYRLKMMDLDGTHEYSPIRSVIFDDSSIDNTSYLRYYPNPTPGAVSLDTDIDMDGYEVQVLDYHGKVLKVMDYEEGLIIQMRDYPEGIYTVRLMDENDNLFFSDRVIRVGG